MRRNGVVNLYLRCFSVAAESALRFGGADRNDKIVDADERPGDRAARSRHRRRDGGAASATSAAGHEPSLLKRFRVGVAGRDALEIAGRGVATRTFDPEIGLPRL